MVLLGLKLGPEGEGHQCGNCIRLGNGGWWLCERNSIRLGKGTASVTGSSRKPSWAERGKCVTWDARGSRGLRPFSSPAVPCWFRDRGAAGGWGSQ